MTDAINTVDDHEIHKCLCYNCVTTKDEVSRKTLPCLQPYHKTHLEKNVFVWKSSVHGYGLFALKQLQQHDIICLYSGEIGSSQTDNAFTCKVRGGSPDEDDILIDSSDHDNYSGRWLNHSRVPNARLVVPFKGIIRCLKTNKHSIIVECIKEIQQHEEIFIDYGKEYDIDGVND